MTPCHVCARSYLHDVRLRHLGLNSYSTTPAVLSEAVDDRWDADASKMDHDEINDRVEIHTVRVRDGRLTDRNALVLSAPAIDAATAGKPPRAGLVPAAAAAALAAAERFVVAVPSASRMGIDTDLTVTRLHDHRLLGYLGLDDAAARLRTSFEAM
jgi:hypothetical protein